MNKEGIKVLELLAQGKLTAEQANQLLEALDDRWEQREDPEDQQPVLPLNKTLNTTLHTADV